MCVGLRKPFLATFVLRCATYKASELRSVMSISLMPPDRTMRLQGFHEKIKAEG